MDRNSPRIRAMATAGAVALRKESVDRNHDISGYNLKTLVALRKESVDRNYQQAQLVNGVQKSLSVRRAWIEMLIERMEDIMRGGRSP